MNDGAYRDTPQGDDDFGGQRPASPNPYGYNPYAPQGQPPGAQVPQQFDPYGQPVSSPGTGGFAAIPPSGQPPTNQPLSGQQPTSPYGQPPIDGQGGQFGPAGPLGPVPSDGGKRGGNGKKLLLGAVVVAVLAGGVGGGVGVLVADRDNGSSSTSASVATGPTETSQPAAAPGSVQDVANRVLPSVVSITVASGRQVGSGSGVILASDGVILTNNHVVQGADQVLVSFNDGSRAVAKVLGTDPVSDIAVIKADKTGLTPVTIGASNNLSVGQNVIAIGSPLGLEGTVTTGIISALNRPVSTSGADGSTESVIDAIQTDAAINPGNSGGALINSSGALIGINTAIATTGGADGESGSIGLGFSIPIDQAMRVAKELRENGKATQANLGVSVRPNSDLEKPGALIASVVRNGPAAKAGIPDGALITGINDRKIAAADALVAAVRSHAPGDTVKVTYTVSNQSKTADVTLGTM